ncbi:MAG TPA: hypothetical protein P5572_13395 [Phycisphaerae bacterium]|nr:hypothetical protein [Phycisphaerae bacterium]
MDRLPDLQRPTPYHEGFTIALFVIAGLAAMMAYSHQMIIGLTAGDEGADAIRIVLRFLQAIEVIYAAAGIAVGCLRAYRAPLARPLTAALSILLIVWVPFGTALFVWWLLRVRAHDRSVA